MLFLGTQCLINVTDPLFDSDAKPVYLQLFPPAFWNLTRTGFLFVLFPAHADLLIGPREFKGATNFSTFLLDRSTGVLFMGARDAILAVDTNRLHRPPEKVGRVCASREFWRIGGKNAEI